MSVEERSPRYLPPAACRDEETLRRFVQTHISVNAWPIHSRSLRRLVLRTGLDLAAASRFSMSLAELERMMETVEARGRRAERLLGIENAFHSPLHNFEVLLRLLVLEWPAQVPRPESVRRAPYRSHRSFASVRPVLLELVEALRAQGVSGAAIARDALAALGHDFGHSGGTDRTDRDGLPATLSQEDAAEKHVAKLGIEHGFPAALVLASMAGIRATTFFSRPGRERIAPANEFERRLTLADVMGCVLPPDQWLTHVSVPLLKEKIPLWRRRMAEIAAARTALGERERALPAGDPERRSVEEELARLAAEDTGILGDLEQWFRSELGFFRFVERHKLDAVAGARELWGHAITEKIALIEDLLSRRSLLSPLGARGFPFLAEIADSLANVESLAERLGRADFDPGLRALLAPFVPAGPG